MKGRHVSSPGKPDRWYIDNKEVTEAEYNQAFPYKPLDLSGNMGLCGWTPIVSEAMCYHPKQVAEAREFYKKKGINVEIRPTGHVVFATRQQRREVLRVNGIHDNQGGYGDG